MKTKKFLVAALALSLLTACGNSGDKKTAATESDTVRLAMYTEIDSLSPFKMTAGDTETVMDQVFDGLFDADEKGNLVPDLAESYTVSEDGTVYTFKLKEGVKFHNGKDFKAEDVAWTYSKLAGLDGEDAKSSKFEIIKSVKAIDDYTVEVTLKERKNEFIYLTLKPIMPKDYDKQEEAPVGTGPFKFVSYSPGEKLVLERNDDYHKKDHTPKYKNLEVIRIKDTQTVLLAIKSGEIDIAPRLAAQDAEQIKDNASFISGPQNLVQTFGLNNNYGPLKDIRVRQAINYAIDRNALVSSCANGKATVLYSNFSPALKEYFADLGEFYPHDIEKAKALLKEAGFEKGFDLTVTVPSDYKYHMDTAEVLESQLKEVGINLSIEPIEFSTWLSKVYTDRDFQSTIVGFIGYLDPNQILGRYTSDNKRDYINYKNPKFDEAIKKASSSASKEEQISYYKEAQKLLAEDAASAFLVDPDTITAMRNGVEGLKLYPIQKLNLEDVTFTK